MREARAERLVSLSAPLDFAATLSRFTLSPEELVNRFGSLDGSPRSAPAYRRLLRLPGGLFLLEAKAEGGDRSGKVRLTLRGRERPGRAAPDRKVPDRKVPDRKVPDRKVSDRKVPDRKVPDRKVPDRKVPDRKVPDRKVLEAAEGALRWVLGMHHDLEGFYRLARRDRVMARLVERFRGLRPAGYLGLYEALTTAVTAQQVNLRFAGSVRAGLVRAFGERMRLGGETHHAFPRPERVARAAPERLRALKFSGPKAAYLVGLARAAAAGALDGGRLARAPLEEAVAELARLRGVGRWTAESALFRGLGRADALPAGDLGVRKVVGRYYRGEELASEEEVRQWGRRWGGYPALAASYLLHAHRAEREGGEGR